MSEHPILTENDGIVTEVKWQIPILLFADSQWIVAENIQYIENNLIIMTELWQKSSDKYL